MNYYCVLLIFFTICSTIMVLAPSAMANYIDVPPEDEVNYPSAYVDDALQQAQQKRACVRRGGNCDHRPNECCYNSSCRCNLWGSNCRCQRMGLFQKWG